LYQHELIQRFSPDITNLPNFDLNLTPELVQTTKQLKLNLLNNTDPFDLNDDA
jgi:hypothetical protein